MNQRKAGTILTYISMLLNSAIMLVYVPMLLHFFTKAEYGLYQLVASMIAYLSVMDFGLSSTITRYYAGAMATEDADKKKRIISSGLFIYAAATALILIVGIILLFFINPVYRNTLSAQELLTAKKIFCILLFNIALLIPGNLFIGLINAHERFVFLRGVNIAKTVLQPLAVFFILSWRADIVNIALTQTAFVIAITAINIFYCFSRLKIKLPAVKPQIPFTKEMAGFSFFVFLRTVSNQVYWQLGQLVLGAVVGVSAVAGYSIAIQISTFYVFLSCAMNGMFLPKLSLICAATNDMTEVNGIFCKIGRLQLFIALTVFFGFVLFGRQFIQIWIGPGFGATYWVAVIIMAAYLICISQSVGISILEAKNKHAFFAYVSVSAIILNILLCIPLARAYGAIGCAAASAICLLLTYGLLMNWHYKRVGLDLKVFFKNFLQIAAPAFIAFALYLPLLKYVLGFTTNIFYLALQILLFMILNTGLAWAAGFNDYEKDLIKTPLKLIR